MLSMNFAKSLRNCLDLSITKGNSLLCPTTSKAIGNRFESDTVSCKPYERRCSPRNLAQSECMKKKKELAKSKRKPFPWKNLIYNPECCDDPCLDVFPRFDDLYYVISKKSKIKYQQTWAECKSPLIKKRVVCTLEGIKPPPYKKRQLRGLRCQKACDISKDAWKLGLMECKVHRITKCPRLVLPGCKASRFPPQCKPASPGPSGCKKRCTPYPAFSECDRPPARKRKPVECECLQGASNCEIVRYFQKLKRNLKFKSQARSDDIC